MQDQQLLLNRKAELQRYELYIAIVRGMAPEAQDYISNRVAEALVEPKRTLYTLYDIGQKFGQPLSDQIRQAFSKAAPRASPANPGQPSGTTAATTPQKTPAKSRSSPAVVAEDASQTNHQLRSATRPNKVASVNAKRKADEPKYFFVLQNIFSQKVGITADGES